jgi:glycosyltransferase involved in cell wall biosynthesis
VTLTSGQNQSLHIVQLVNTLAVSDGGPPRNSFELNRSLNLTGWATADLFWMKGEIGQSVLVESGELVTGLPSPGPRRLHIKSNVANRQIGLLGFFKVLCTADIVIVHGYYLGWVPLAALLAKICGCELFLMPHGALTLRQQKHSVLLKWFFDAVPGRIIRRSLLAFVTGSVSERTELLRRFPGCEVRVAGVGVGLPEKSREPGNCSRPIRLLSMSRIADKKRIDISIAAVSVLRDRGVDVTLTIAGVGSDELTRALKMQAANLGVEAQVLFIGQVSGKIKTDLFLMSDIFLLPSEDENFGIGFAEATSFGLPSIVSRNVAAAEGLPESAGKILTDATAEEIAESVIFLSQPHIFQGAITDARIFAVENFSWAAAAEKWREAIVPLRDNARRSGRRRPTGSSR